MHMIFGKPEFTEFETKAFQVMERLDAGVDMALFSKIPISVMCGKHHSHPAIAGVTRNLFRAYATFIYQKFHVPVAPIEGTPYMVCRVRQENDIIYQEKKGRPFICGEGLHPRS